MKRVVAAWVLCILALVVGLTTAALSAHNRARGDELDRVERWCEAQSRRNELLRVDNQRREWHMLGSLEDPCAPAGDAHARDRDHARGHEGAAVP